MKIIYLHQYFNKPDDAGSSRTYEMARRWVKAGHEVEVVTSDRSGLRPFGSWRIEDVAGISVHWLANPYSNGMGVRARLRSFIAFALLSSARARKLRGDVVFATSTPLTIAVPAILSTLFRRTPYVFEVRDLWPTVPIAMGFLKNPILRWIAYRLEALAYSRAGHIVALSPDMREGIATSGVPRDKITVVPNAADLELFNPISNGDVWRGQQSWLGQRTLILYCGTLGMVNDVQYLVEVAHYVKIIDDQIRFGIVGDGAEKDAVRRLARQRDVLGSTLFMLDQVPKNEVPEIFASAALTVSTVAPVEALHANSANKLFDSFAAGRPVAINHGGWQARLLSESGAGIVLSAEDPQTAAIDLVEFIKNDDVMSKARSSAYKLAETMFSRESLAKELLQVLQTTRDTEC